MTEAQEQPARERDGDDRSFQALLAHITEVRGFEASSYKLATLRRRIDKRLAAVGVPDYRSYQDQLEVDPPEYARLFDTVLINVTDMFRDADAWQLLADEVVPQLLATTDPALPIRVWSAGCSSGEEAYSLAITFAEAMGEEEFRQRITIYGTDIDEDALETARQAQYPREQLARLPHPILERYFEAPRYPLPRTSSPHDGDAVTERLAFRADLRRNVVFGRHDLLRDAPISRLDLLACRNTLMYFNAEAQPQVVERFHFALRPDGVLFLGRAERPLRDRDRFETIHARHRLFRKVGRTSTLPRRIGEGHDRSSVSDHLATNVALRDAALDEGPEARLCVDLEERLTLANAPARRWFRLEGRDLGRPLRDLQVSYRPAELRGLLEEVRREGEAVRGRDVTWAGPGGETRHLEVSVMPLASGGTPLGHLITFVDVSQVQELRRQLEESETRQRRLRGDLQTSTEELETTNEELESTVEELQTTNEELQSTNEELEAINAELHATNHELHLTKGELQGRGLEITEVNAFLGAVVHRIPRAVVVVDPDLRVRIWNDQAADLWGLRADEVVGIEFATLDIGLPVEDLVEPLRACLTREAASVDRELAGRNRRGMPIGVRVSLSPVAGEADEVLGVCLVMDEDRG